MVKRVIRKHWDRIPDLIDYNIQLTEYEESLMYDVITRIVNNIFRREKNPIKRRVLIDCIGKTAVNQSIFSTIKKESYYKQRMLKKISKK